MYLCYPGSKVRLATLELSILLLRALVHQPSMEHCYLQDRHLAAIEGAREEATLQLRNFYKVWEKVAYSVHRDSYRAPHGSTRFSVCTFLFIPSLSYVFVCL